MYSYQKYNSESDSLLKTHSTVDDLEKVDENEVECAGCTETRYRYRSPVIRHITQSYILTYYSLKNRETVTALGSHQGGLLISASADPTVGNGAVY